MERGDDLPRAGEPGLRAGWIGLGIMGGPMAANLLRAGFRVTVFNRTRSRTDPLRAAGAAVADAPRDVASVSDVVFVSVSDTPDVEEVLFGPSGVAEGARAGTIVVDTSTISPEATRSFARRLAERGVTLVDAPVSGGERGAADGTLSIMAGGEEAALARCRPLLAALGKRITHLGPSGSGQAAKLANQVLVLGNLLAACEGLLLGAASGLDLERLIEALGGGAAASWQLAELGPKIVRRDFAPGFPIGLARKDLRLVHEAARGLDLALPGAALAEQLLSAAAAAGAERSGTQALVTALERLSGRRVAR